MVPDQRVIMANNGPKIIPVYRTCIATLLDAMKRSDRKCQIPNNTDCKITAQTIPYNWINVARKIPLKITSSYIGAKIRNEFGG